MSSPQVVYLNEIGETGTIRQRLYMKGDSDGQDDVGRTHAHQSRRPCRRVPCHGKEMAGALSGRRVGRAARSFLKAKEVATAHPGQDHQADISPCGVSG